jgi:predicted  nucleic acid-binding Zn-ribbon protein
LRRTPWRRSSISAGSRWRARYLESAPTRGTTGRPAPTTAPEEHTLKADHGAQLRLLDLQDVDSTLDQLSHRLAHLPEQAALAALGERRVDLVGQLGQTQTEVDDLAREQRKADADVEQVKSRRVRDRERVDGGLVSDPKQLQAIQHEIGTLDRRISDLEDEELAVMERLEEAQQSLDRLSGELAAVETEGTQALKARDEAMTEISSRDGDARAEREKIAGDVPSDLLTLYERLRAQLGGVGVGALRQGRCGGCQLAVGAADLARMAAAPDDEVLRCEECNRILVRTAESGIWCPATG